MSKNPYKRPAVKNQVTGTNQKYTIKASEMTEES